MAALLGGPLGKHGEGNRKTKDHEKRGDHMFILSMAV